METVNHKTCHGNLHIKCFGLTFSYSKYTSKIAEETNWVFWVRMGG